MLVKLENLAPKDAAVFSYLLISAIMLNLNKLAIISLSAPYFLTFVQTVFSCIVLFSVSCTAPMKISTKDACRFFGPGIVWALPLAFNMRALLYLNPETLIVFRVATIIGVSVGDAFFFNKVFKTHEILSVVTLLFGVALYAGGDLHYDQQGYFWGLVYWGTMAFGMLFLKAAFNSTADIGNLEKTFYLNLGGSLVFALLALCFESRKIVPLVRDLDATGVAIVGLSCIFGVVIGYLASVSRDYLSPTAFDILSNVSKFMTIAISKLLFQTQYTKTSLCGLLLSIFGGSLYSPVFVKTICSRACCEFILDRRLRGGISRISKVFVAVLVCTAWFVFTSYGSSSSSMPASKVLTPPSVGLQPARITLVSAYFEIPSKHTSMEYDTWSSNFLSLDESMVIFTSASLIASIQTRRRHMTGKTCIVQIELDRLGEVVDQSLHLTFWQSQFSMDPERTLHKSYKLFWIWLAKPWFVTQAIERNPFASDIFVWSDYGCFRDSKYNGRVWVTNDAVIPATKMLMMSFRKDPKHPGSELVIKQEHSSSGEFFMSGAQMAGYSSTWMKYFEDYKVVLARYIERGLFIGDDQPLLQSTCMIRAMSCIYVLPHDLSGDPFFGLQEVLHGDVRAVKFWSHESVLPGKKRRGMACSNEIRTRSNYAIFTMLTDGEEYVRGAVTLKRSAMKHIAADTDFVYLELSNKPLSNSSINSLDDAGWQRCIVDRIAPLDEEGTFERFRDQFTKLHIWGMTAYDRVLYMDSDALVIGNIDGLLRLELHGSKIGASRDFSAGAWLPTFNMGVFLIEPSEAEYEQLLQLQRDPKIQFHTTMSEQGFLNVVYEGNWTDLGFEHNANLAVYSQGKDFWESHADNIKIVHYTMSKPWACSSEYSKPCSLWYAYQNETDRT